MNNQRNYSSKKSVSRLIYHFSSTLEERLDSLVQLAHGHGHADADVFSKDWRAMLVTGLAGLPVLFSLWAESLN